MATVADILDQDLPEGAAEDSTSILPLLAGEKTELPDRPGVINHDGYNRLAIRNGPWKLITGMAPQLFNLEFDPKRIQKPSQNTLQTRNRNAKAPSHNQNPIARIVRKRETDQTFSVSTWKTASVIP